MKLKNIHPTMLKGPGDFDPPEYADGPECPECEAWLEKQTWDEKYKCPDCKYERDMPEDPRIEALEFERLYGN